jgi:dihydroneopterin aldolase
MKQTYTVQLNELAFFSYHGIHEEEKIIGSKYEVSVAVESNSLIHIVGIEDTIDYTKLFDIVKSKMAQPTPLLETVAQSICDDICDHFKNISAVTISIKKLNPPIAIEGNVGVSLKRIFD